MQFKKMFVFIGGILLAFLVGLFAGFKRTSGHNESGAADLVNREGEFQDGIVQAENGEREEQDRITELESRVNKTGTGINDIEAGITNTDRIAEQLKKRNGLE